jgi:DNA-binding NtrC family response regulator
MNNATARPKLIAVDDDPEALANLTSIMETHYTVLATSNSQRAIAWLEKDPAVSVIIVDQVLKTGLGLDVLESARALRPDVRRVLITRYTDLANLVKGLHSGAINRMVSKPLVRGELASILAPAELTIDSRQIRAAV